MQGKVFISYARTDHVFALQLGSDLKAAGIDIWLDQLDIRPGDPWDQSIESNLTASAAMVVVLSPDSAASRSVLDEVNLALDTHMRVVPVLYRTCAIPLQIRRLHYTDFTSDYDRGLAQLVNTLREPAPAPPPSEPITISSKPREPDVMAPVVVPPTEIPSKSHSEPAPPKEPQTHSTTSVTAPKPAAKSGASARVALTVGVLIILALCAFLWWRSARSSEGPDDGTVVVTDATTTPSSAPPIGTTQLTVPFDPASIRFDDPPIDQCNGDSSCIERAAYARKLRDMSAADWKNLRYDSALLSDCMGYQPCEATASEALALQKLDFKLIARDDAKRRACREFGPCLNEFPPERPSTDTATTTTTTVRKPPPPCDPETLPACCKNAANPEACRACKKREDLRDECF